MLMGTCGNFYFKVLESLEMRYRHVMVSPSERQLFRRKITGTAFIQITTRYLNPSTTPDTGTVNKGILKQKFLE